MKKSVLPLLFCFPMFLFANIAQPGMWQAGGMGNFSLLYPEDSLAYQQIQMVKERISIQLYHGYAVVKGSYWMRNDTPDTYRIKTGYPINSAFEGTPSSHLMQLDFYDLYEMQVMINGTPQALLPDSTLQYEIENWKVWENEFPANSTTQIDVYFLMNTNNASVLEGYQKDYSNGFIYLLETGAIWKQPIIDGEIRLEVLIDGNLENITGVYPSTFLQQAESEAILKGSFKNLSPSFKDNIVIRYADRIQNFDFQKIIEQKEILFQKADQFSQRDLSTLTFVTTAFGDPFDVYYIEPGRGLKTIYDYFYIPIIILLVLFGSWFFMKKKKSA